MAIAIKLSDLQSRDTPEHNLIAQALLPTQRKDFDRSQGIEAPIDLSPRVHATRWGVSNASFLMRAFKSDIGAPYWPGNRYFKAHPIDSLTGLTTVGNLVDGGIGISKAIQAAHRSGLT